MKNEITIVDEHPDQCPREICDANGDDIAISNIDGYECMKCGCWFETISNSRKGETAPTKDYTASVEWAYHEAPMHL